MQMNLNNEDEDMVTLEFIFEEIKEQLKLILLLVERYKRKKSYLMNKFKARKQLLFQIVHESDHFEVRIIY